MRYVLGGLIGTLVFIIMMRLMNGSFQTKDIVTGLVTMSVTMAVMYYMAQNKKDKS